MYPCTETKKTAERHMIHIEKIDVVSDTESALGYSFGEKEKRGSRQTQTTQAQQAVQKRAARKVFVNIQCRK